MHSDVNSVSLEYGDTSFAFFHVHLGFPQDHITWHSHSYYEMHICEKGCIAYSFPDRELCLKPGGLLIIPPNTPHIPLRNDDRLSSTVVSITVTPIENKNKFYSIFSNALNRNALTPLSIPNISNAELKLFSHDSLYCSLLGICKLKSVAANFICLLFNQLISDNNVPVFNQKDILVLLNELVNVPGVTLDEIAAATHYSKRHVARLIKKQYGIPLTKLQQQQKEHLNEKEIF